MNTEAAIEVIEPGQLTTVQDLGRHGWQSRGITTGGAVDRQAVRVGNLLLANEDNAAALECTLNGPRLLFRSDSFVCLCGAQTGHLPMWRPFPVAAGTTLDIGRLRRGARLYLTVAGGIETPLILGSRSTHLQARFGGVEGRMLRAGDILPLGSSRLKPGTTTVWTAAPDLVPHYGPMPQVRVIPGPQWDSFSGIARTRFLATDFRVRPQSDRMGVRLEGTPVEHARKLELISEPVVAGSIQIPPDGNPIVLLADHQTLGGYAKIATVISVDLPLIAQLRPGDHVRFVPVRRDEAERLYRNNEISLHRMHSGMAVRRIQA